MATKTCVLAIITTKGLNQNTHPVLGKQIDCVCGYQCYCLTTTAVTSITVNIVSVERQECIHSGAKRRRRKIRNKKEKMEREEE